MNEPRYPHTHDGMIRCEVCLKEVPRDRSLHSEVEEYVAYFCGAECYEAWNRQQAEAEIEEHA